MAIIPHVSTSSATEEALKHLKSIKALDGWSADVYWSSDGQQKTMLCRRNVPLSDDGFADIYYDRGESECVVGLKSAVLTTASSTASNTTVKGVVLVEANGTVARANREISVRVVALPTVVPKAPTTAANNSRKAKPAEQARSTKTITDEENKQLLKMAFYVILLSVALKAVLASALGGLLLIAIPILLYYASQTVPSPQSFDAKRELKRVLHGEHLPVDHPEKPKTWLEQTLARVGATVTAEVATGLGYDVSLTNIVGLATVAYVRVPMAHVDCYWLGAFGKWYYITTFTDQHKNNQQAR